MLLSSTTISDGRKPKVNNIGIKLLISDGTFGSFVQSSAYVSYYHSVIQDQDQVIPNRDGKEPAPSKNEQSQNPGFAKNRSESEPEVKCARTRTEPNPTP